MKIHLIGKTKDLLATIEYIHATTAGIFGNIEAFKAGEKIENCLPSACVCIMHNGEYFLRVAVDPEFESLWPVGVHGPFEILGYPAYIEHTDPDTGEVTQTPNREPYNCGSYVWTDEAGKEHTQDTILGGWG